MTTNFVLTHISEKVFFDFADSPEMGTLFLKCWEPVFYDWLVENEIGFTVKFEYGPMFSSSNEIRVRLEVADEKDAVLVRLKWS
jgi:hypothetical protein